MFFYVMLTWLFEPDLVSFLFSFVVAINVQLRASNFCKTDSGYFYRVSSISKKDLKHMFYTASWKDHSLEFLESLTLFT